MTITNVARVTIHRIRISDAHSVAGEPGNNAEWNLIFNVNGQYQVKYISVPLSAGTISPGYDVDLGYSFVVPLYTGKVVIRVFGDEIDDTTPDDQISPLQRTYAPAQDFPMGASWLSASVGVLEDNPDAEPFFPYKRGTDTIGGYTIWYSIEPFDAHWKDSREYFPLVRSGLAYSGWYVAGWDTFTKNQDQWAKEGLRLRRVATHLTDASSPRFADTGTRTFMGVYDAGEGSWQFWLLGLEEFADKMKELQRHYRCDDIFCYYENGQVMVGGVFTESHSPTELISLPDEKFVGDYKSRKSQGQRLISVDTWHDGQMRWYLGLYEKGDYDQEFVPNQSWNDFSFGHGDLQKKNLRIADYCLHNDGGEVRISTVWREGYIPQEWLLHEKGYQDLKSRIDYNIAMERQVHNIDSWSPQDPE